MSQTLSSLPSYFTPNFDVSTSTPREMVDVLYTCVNDSTFQKSDFKVVVDCIRLLESAADRTGRPGEIRLRAKEGRRLAPASAIF